MNTYLALGIKNGKLMEEYSNCLSEEERQCIENCYSSVIGKGKVICIKDGLSAEAEVSKLKEGEVAYLLFGPNTDVAYTIERLLLKGCQAKVFKANFLSTSSNLEELEDLVKESAEDIGNDFSIIRGGKYLTFSPKTMG